MHKNEIHALLTPAHLDRISRAWGIDGTQIQFIRAMENFVYEFRRNDKKYILRLTHSSHRSRDEVVAELEFVDYLGSKGVPVAHAVPSLNNNLVETLPVDESHFFAAVFEYAEGSIFAFDQSTEVTNTFYQDWGAMIGAMHQVVPAYRNGQPDARRHTGIEDDITRNAARYLPPHAQHVLALRDELLGVIKKLPRSPDQYGLLHTDCHQGNFYVAGRQLTLFDFDDSCHQWFAYDLAVPLWHFPVKDRGVNPAEDRARLTHFATHYLRGYQTKYPLPRDWQELLPLFLRLRDIQLFVFSYKMADPVNPNPAMTEFLRKRLALIETRRPSVDVHWDKLVL